MAVGLVWRAQGGTAAGASWGRMMKERLVEEQGGYKTRLHIKSLVFVREKRFNSPPVEQQRIMAL